MEENARLYGAWIAFARGLWYHGSEGGKGMNQERTGALIRRLRQEKGLTQRELAQRIGVGDKAVSKWERGMGCPDVSLLASLSQELGVGLESMLEGGLPQSPCQGGNMKRIRFYVCPACGNVITATGEVSVSCCGRRLEAMQSAPCDEAHTPRIEAMDGESYVTFAHPMDKAHHLLFVACAGYDRVTLARLYPEQDAALRLPAMAHGTYYVGCSRDGLFTLRV